MKGTNRIRQSDSGMTLIEVLIATVILSFGSVAVVGALGTLSSGSSINRVQSSVASVVRNAAEVLKLSTYIPCTSSSFDPQGVFGYASLPQPQGLGGFAVTVNDPPNNPPLPPKVTGVTDQAGTSLVGCQADPGLQLVTVQVMSTDGKVISQLTVTKTVIDHTPNAPITPTVTGTASPGSLVLGSAVADSVSVTGTPTPTGSVQFYICGPDGSAVPCSVSADNVNNAGTGSLTNGSVTSTPYTPNAVGTWCFLVAYLGDRNYNPNSDATASRQCVSVVPVATQPTFPLIVSGSTPPMALHVMGKLGTLNVAGPIMIDATANNAVQLDTAGDLISTTGAYDTASTTPGSTCNGAGCSLITWTHQTAPSDPLATLPPPSTSVQGTCTTTGTTAACTPGLFSTDPGGGGGSIGAAVRAVTFAPGNYYFNNGFTLNSGPMTPLTVSGSGVFFYVAKGNVNLNPTTWTISPPSSGTYSGMFLFKGNGDKANVTIGGSTSTGTSLGTIYVPTATVQFSGGTPMAVTTLTLTFLSASWVSVQDNTNVTIVG